MTTPTITARARTHYGDLHTVLAAAVAGFTMLQ